MTILVIWKFSDVIVISFNLRYKKHWRYSQSVLITLYKKLVKSQSDELGHKGAGGHKTAGRGLLVSRHGRRMSQYGGVLMMAIKLLGLIS